MREPCGRRRGAPISAQKSSERGEGCARTDVRPARPSGIVPKPQWGSLGTDCRGIGLTMPHSRREFLTPAGLLAAGAPLSAPGRRRGRRPYLFEDFLAQIPRPGTNEIYERTEVNHEAGKFLSEMAGPVSAGNVDLRSALGRYADLKALLDASALDQARAVASRPGRCTRGGDAASCDPQPAPFGARTELRHRLHQIDGWRTSSS